MIKLRARLLDLEAGGKFIVILNRDDAEEIGALGPSRVRVSKGSRDLIAIVNLAVESIPRGYIGIYNEVKGYLGLKDGEEVYVESIGIPASVYHIRNKLGGRRLTYEEIYEIVRDIVNGKLSEIETAAFIVALHTFGLDLDEATSLSLAMVETGSRLDLKKPLIVDKHSIGGVPGDKTTLLVVPIIAASGLTIPKSSSRAITSAAGTADRAEAIMPVNLRLDEVREVVEKANGCIVWGGTLDLAPADDIFIRVEHPLSIDPILLPSIMSKKKAVGANFLAIDIPTGRGTKVKTIGEADLLAKDFIELGRRLGIRVKCAVTYGEQPIGYAIGPALEAWEALNTLMGRSRPYDLIDKATHIAGILLEMSGKIRSGGGRDLALKILESGKAEEKLREIISAQGGNPKITPEDIALGSEKYTVYSRKNGLVLWIDNSLIVEAARMAGAPRDKGAGILLHKKIGDKVSKGEPLVTIYAERSSKLEKPIKVFEETPAIGVGDRMEMLIHEIEERPITKKTFILER
ncbi:MAG: AMP phosphorylase [Candidatus Bathyarchaeia archaeon]